MPLKPQITHNVSIANVPKKVPGEFKDLIKLGRLCAANYTVIAFPGMRGNSTSIIDSKTLNRALNKCESLSEPIIIVAHDFTLEARSLMEERNVIAFFKSDFGWTDKRWAYIRDEYC